MIQVEPQSQLLDTTGQLRNVVSHWQDSSHRIPFTDNYWQSPIARDRSKHLAVVVVQEMLDAIDLVFGRRARWSADRPQHLARQIDSLAVGRTDDPTLSRMTIVVVGDDRVVEQVRKQLAKIVSVVKVQDFVGQDTVARDLMLISIACPADKRPEILALVEMFQAKVVDIGAKFVMVEVSGPENKIEAFIEACRTYGIKNMVRTGTVAMARQTQARTEAEKIQA